MASWLRRALLQLAARQDPDVPIYRIAAEAGYTSEAAFSRAFTARYGASPRDVRRAGVPADGHDSNAPGLDRRYENWLLHLGL